MKFSPIRIIIIILLTTSTVLAQKGEPVVLRVTYDFTHVNDLNRPKQPYKEEMILRVGKTESRYNSWTDEAKAKVARKNLNSGGTGATSGGGTYGFSPTVFVKSKGVQDFDLLQHHTTNKLVRIATLADHNYLIESELPKIDWKLENEKKILGGYTCQKAVGQFAGRVYTAWFAPELPFKSGPWKLSGLPGLILEATDNKGEVSFLFKELNKSEDKETTAARKTRIIKTTEKAFERAKTAFEKDPVAVYQGQLPIGTTDRAQIAFTDSDGNHHFGEEGKKLYELNKKAAQQRKFNPIELPATRK